MDKENSTVVREAEAARILAVSVAALRRWRREGRGPTFVRIERCVRYRVADLEHFLRRSSVPASEQSHDSAVVAFSPHDHIGPVTR